MAAGIERVCARGKRGLRGPESVDHERYCGGKHPESLGPLRAMTEKVFLQKSSLHAHWTKAFRASRMERILV